MERRPFVQTTHNTSYRIERPVKHLQGKQTPFAQQQGGGPVAHQQGKKSGLGKRQDVQHRWEWHHAVEIPLLPSFLYLYNEDESLASPCILPKIN